MNTEQTKSWESLVQHVGEIEALVGARGLLQWDQQVLMPPGGAQARGRIEGILSAICHDKMVDPSLGGWLETLEGAELDDLHSAGVRNIQRDRNRSLRVPKDLVTRMAEATSKGFGAWIKARGSGRFEDFSPALSEILMLVKERVAALRQDEACNYDVLLDEFDPGTTSTWLNPIFERLSGELGTLITAVQNASAPETALADFGVDAQKILHREVAEAMGFDFSEGRLDESEHPFTCGMGVGDIRLTTRYFAEDLLQGLGGTVHETGHGLYEQGLRKEWFGTGVGRAASFGLHESQSRFWENFIGRSLPFFQYLAPRVVALTGVNISAEQLYGAANRVQPSLVRVAADEATYNLHILVRYRLEQELLDGDMSVNDLPDAWADLYEEVLGIRPQNAVEGVLQDVHWGTGAFGYFPSYSIGNLYAASLGAQIVKEIPQMWDQVAAGEFSDILGWLRDRVHRVGHLYDAPEIIQNAVGERDPVEDLVSHLWNRQGRLYGVERPA